MLLYISHLASFSLDEHKHWITYVSIYDSTPFIRHQIMLPIDIDYVWVFMGYDYILFITYTNTYITYSMAYGFCQLLFCLKACLSNANPKNVSTTLNETIDNVYENLAYPHYYVKQQSKTVIKVKIMAMAYEWSNTFVKSTSIHFIFI